MLHKLSIRWRLTLVSALLISVCCVGLTLVLNDSTYRLAETLEPQITTPALEGTNNTIEQENTTEPLPLTNTLQEAKSTYQIESILFTILAVLLGSSVTYYAAGRILSPVRLLNMQVKALNINDLMRTLDVPPTKDEIAELTSSFNEMSNKLHEAFSMQRRFSASAAHELRTPLTILQTKIDVFNKKDSHTPQEYDALIQTIKKQTIRLNELIKNLLHLTNFDEVEEEEINLRYLLEEIVDELKNLMLERKIHISLKCEDECIYGNVDLFYRAFYNLVENAIKYNVEKGIVDIVCENTKDKLSICIKDYGIGIDDLSKKHIFEPFFRVDTSRSRAMGGAGLGLAMVDKIIKHYQGTITILDEVPQGTCFKIELPKIHKQ